jgi:ligand-binding sensor domain-containing protein
MQRNGILILVILALMFAVIPIANGSPQKSIPSPGRSESLSPKDAVADSCWILLLCAFSFAARYRKGRNPKIRVLALAFFLLMLAAIHSHPLWSFSRINAGSHQDASLTRIVSVPAAVIETGLEIDDIVHAMYFDPGGKLWMSANNSGPYIYSVPTNELTTHLRPDYVYGLFPDVQGMWILTSSGAVLYREESIIKTIYFPLDVIPLCGARLEEDIFFGTTKGLYRARYSDSIALHEVLDARVNQVVRQKNGLILATDRGVLQVNKDGRVQDDGSQFSASAIALVSGQVLAATDSHGIVIAENPGWKQIRFVRKSMNLFLPGTSASIRKTPFFGAMDGSLIFLANNEWKRVLVGDSAITAVAAKDDFIYAWTNGRLLRISF